MHLVNDLVWLFCLSNTESSLDRRGIYLKLFLHSWYNFETAYNNTVPYNENVDSTGQTPVRREYSFSRILSSTSPHERILSRYRAGAVSTVSKISLPSFRDDAEVSIYSFTVCIYKISWIYKCIWEKKGCINHVKSALGSWWGREMSENLSENVYYEKIYEWKWWGQRLSVWD